MALGGGYGEDGGKAKTFDIDCDTDTGALRHDDDISLSERLHSNFTHAPLRHTAGAEDTPTTRRTAPATPPPSGSEGNGFAAVTPTSCSAAEEWQESGWVPGFSADGDGDAGTGGLVDGGAVGRGDRSSSGGGWEREKGETGSGSSSSSSFKGEGGGTDNTGAGRVGRSSTFGR